MSKSFPEAGTLLLPEELETQISSFLDQYNNHRYHESLENVIPADAYFDRGKEILQKRQQIKNRL